MLPPPTHQCSTLLNIIIHSRSHFKKYLILFCKQCSTLVINPSQVNSFTIFHNGLGVLSIAGYIASVGSSTPLSLSISDIFTASPSLAIPQILNLRCITSVVNNTLLASLIPLIGLPLTSQLLFYLRH